jgi:DNA-binding NarL/FixJ family response regulator
MIEIAITDDHPIVIEGIRMMLKSNKEIVVSKSFTSISEMFTGLDHSIKVLLLDINLPDGNGITACKDLVFKFPSLKIIALTNFEDVSFIKQIMKNGAMGYLLKNTGKNELIEAIKTVLQGDRYLQQNISKILLNESLGKIGVSSFFIPKLTNREKEILLLISKEYTTQQIAAEIFISNKTVESHRNNLMQKLGVKNSAGLVRVAFEKGFI